MDEERKHYAILSAFLFANCGLLLIKFLPNVLFWNIKASDFLWDALGLLWPFLGASTALEFLAKDKWGWGGILFHIFTYYCGIYYAILTVQAIATLFTQLEVIGIVILHATIATLAWVSYFYYYD